MFDPSTSAIAVTGQPAINAALAVALDHHAIVAITDFGTGYSSLVYLKRFPASRLKIDSQFVRDMLTDSNDAAIVETVLAMARSLRLDTVAEGVESQAHARRLRELGCRIAQGYLYAPALSAEVFAREWL